ncbi:phage tail assembly protein [Celerinatantimonas sp. MCCC 1A17872]|uniref:phage tail assembly protein n=1 Tax=Celerinatantimonas sp. MCCC 1A17872 TaxID=3177514 RepID=UPI0038C355D8
MTEPKLTTVTLDDPLSRGEQTITTLTLRKPSAGELRGLSLVDVMQMDVNAMTKLLPRLTQPTLTEDEVRRLSPADLVQLGTEVNSFLVPKQFMDYQTE